MSAPTDSLAWVARAEEDYALARSALRRKQPLVYGACFHAQQCAEKYLKAVLVSQETAFPKTHDLLALENLCAQAGIVLMIDSTKLDMLTAYAVRTRYPGEDPTTDEAREALAIAKLVRRLTRKFLGL